MSFTPKAYHLHKIAQRCAYKDVKIMFQFISTLLYYQFHWQSGVSAILVLLKPVQRSGARWS